MVRAVIRAADQRRSRRRRGCGRGWKHRRCGGLRRCSALALIGGLRRCCWAGGRGQGGGRRIVLLGEQSDDDSDTAQYERGGGNDHRRYQPRAALSGPAPPVVGAAAAALAVLIVEPMVARFVAAAVTISGFASKNDIPHLFPRSRQSPPGAPACSSRPAGAAHPGAPSRYWTQTNLRCGPSGPLTPLRRGLGRLTLDSRWDRDESDGVYSRERATLGSHQHPARGCGS